MRKESPGTQMYESAKRLQADLHKAKQALRLADGIMDYCRGDKWERECTTADRAEFDKIYDELMGGK